MVGWFLNKTCANIIIREMLTSVLGALVKEANIVNIASKFV